MRSLYRKNFDIRQAPKIKVQEDIIEVEKWMANNPAPFSTSFELLHWAAWEYGEIPAIKFINDAALDSDVVTVSYDELLENVSRAGKMFSKLAGNDLPIVSYLLPNLPQTHYTLWGAQAVGIVNPLNPFLESNTISELMVSAGSNLLVTSGPSVSQVQWEKAVIVAKNNRNLKAIVVVDSKADTELLSKEAGLPVFQFDDELANHNNDPEALLGKRVAIDISAYFHTGGTTGSPKIVCHSHANQVANVISGSLALPGEIGDVCLVGLPLFHVNAVLGTGLMSLLKGHTVLLATSSGFRTPGLITSFWQNVERHKVSMFSCVPTVLSMLLDVPLGKSDISSLKMVVSGAAPLSIALAEKFIKITGATLIESYGLSEASCISTVNPIHGEQRIGSIGMRLPSQEFRVVKMEGENQVLRNCQVEEVGVLQIRGRNVFNGYLDASKNEGVLLNDDWLNTGDLVRMDIDGYIWISGREKELIIRGGHNIDPSIIEEILMSHDDVNNVAAIGQPDAYAGELPCVYVSLANEQHQDVTRDLMNYVTERISERAAIPVYIEIVPELPVTAVGKVFKPELRRRATQRVIKSCIQKVDREAIVKADLCDQRGLRVAISSSLSELDISTLLESFSVDWEVVV